MLYKQYSSKEINGKILPKSRGSEIVQFSIQSRPGSRITINENEIESIYYIGNSTILEWDDISINAHLTDDNNFNTIITVEIESGQDELGNKIYSAFDGAIIDVLYNTTKEEELNLE